MGLWVDLRGSPLVPAAWVLDLDSSSSEMPMFMKLSAPLQQLRDAHVLMKLSAPLQQLSKHIGDIVPQPALLHTAANWLLRIGHAVSRASCGSARGTESHLSVSRSQSHLWVGTAKRQTMPMTW